MANPDYPGLHHIQDIPIGERNEGPVAARLVVGEQEQHPAFADGVADHTGAPAVDGVVTGGIRPQAVQLGFVEQDLIREQLLFYTLERSGPVWRFFDARTYRTGPLDVEYFVGLMEQLV